jgi:cytochrome P450
MSTSPTSESFLEIYDQTPDAQKVALLFQWVAAKPLVLFAELRAKRPILVVPAGPVLVTRFADVEEVLTRNLQFQVLPYAPKMDPSVGPFMLARDGTVYNQRDKGIMRALIQEFDMPSVRRTVAELAKAAILGGASPDFRLDVVTQVSRPVPVQLTGRYFGFPGPDITTMLSWSFWTQYDMFHNLTNDSDIHAKNVAAGQAMKAYLSDFLPRRAEAVAQDSSADDIVARLLRLRTPPTIGFDMERIMSNVMGLLVGGIETTNAAVVQAIDQILNRPDALAQALQAALAGDDAQFDAIFWEALRFNPINPFVGRILVEPYVVAAGTERELTLPARAFVLASGTSAMHDETVVPDPEVFKPGRPAYHYLHLGFGEHRCLGDQVSLQQAPELAKQIFLAGYTKRAPGAAGQLNFNGGPFPEHFTLTK